MLSQRGGGAVRRRSALLPLGVSFEPGADAGDDSDSDSDGSSSDEVLS